MLRVLYAHNRYLVPGGEDVSTLSEVEMLRAAGHVADLWEVSNEAIHDIGPVAAGIRAIWSHRRRGTGSPTCPGRYDLLHVQNYFPLPVAGSASCGHGDGRRDRSAFAQLSHDVRQRELLSRGPQLPRLPGQFRPWRGVVRKCYKGSAAMSLAPAAMVAVHKALGTFTNHVDAYIAISHYVRDAHCASGLPQDRIHMRYDTLDAPIRQIAQSPRQRAIVAPLRLTPGEGN